MLQLFSFLITVRIIFSFKLISKKNPLNNVTLFCFRSGIYNMEFLKKNSWDLFNNFEYRSLAELDLIKTFDKYGPKI